MDFTKAVIAAQDARGKTLEEIRKQFNAAKGHTKLTGDQLKDVVRAMDAEGLTSVKPGRARTVNYDTSGKSKTAKKSKTPGTNGHILH